MEPTEHFGIYFGYIRRLFQSWVSPFNPSALSDCSTDPSPPLHWRTESRPCRHPKQTPVVHSPAYLAAFARFPNKRHIAVGKFERNVKDHLSMFLKLRFHVIRCSRNDTFLRAFVDTLSFFGLRQAAQCQRLYSTPATDAPVLVADRSGRPSSPSPPRPPTPTGILNTYLPTSPHPWPQAKLC